MHEYLARLAGTLASTFRINAVRLKDTGGVLTLRNAGDTANIPLEASALKLTGGNPASGKVLVSDASGNGSWQDLSGAQVTVRDIDGTPSLSASTIEFTNGTVQDQGGGVARVNVGAGSSVKAWMPDAPPPSPSSYDEEFNTSPLDGDWTVTLSGSAAYTVGQDGHPGIWCKHNGGNFTLFRLMPEVKYSAWAYIGMSGSFASMNAWIGPRTNGTGDSAAKAYYGGLAASSSSILYVIQRQNYLGSYETNLITRTVANTAAFWPGTGLYVRWIYDPSTKALDFFTSNDGLGWFLQYTVTTPTVLNAMQFFAGGCNASFIRFFRVSTTLTNRDDPLPGRYINLPI